MIIDVHTHAFPDSLAARAIAHLEVGNARAFSDGTVAGLLRSMDSAGVDRSVICSIATKPEQFDPILKWSLSIRSDRLIPLASIHPADPLAVARVGEVKAAGLKGIKIHPYYQGFDLADHAFDSFYAAVESSGLVLVSHTGFDMAFPRDRRADASRSLDLVTRFPNLKFMATHFGAWNDWDDVEAKLIGKPINLEISLTLEFLSPEQVRRMILAHPEDRLFFGTDSPWGNPEEPLRVLRELNLPAPLLQKILSGNAAALFRDLPRS
jgi:predicted TIM-barrel fold metal-dependent hydrolase